MHVRVATGSIQLELRLRSDNDDVVCCSCESNCLTCALLAYARNRQMATAKEMYCLHRHWISNICHRNGTEIAHLACSSAKHAAEFGDIVSVEKLDPLPVCCRNDSPARSEEGSGEG